MSLSNIQIGVQALDNSWDSDNAPVHASHNVTETSLIITAIEAGIQIVRIPMDLSLVTATGFPQWKIDSFQSVLQIAHENGIKLIIQPGQTPAELTDSNDVRDAPSIENIGELANRYAIAVQQIYSEYPQYADTIQGWEVGNEPNLSYVYTDNVTSSTAEAIYSEGEDGILGTADDVIIPGIVNDVTNNRYYSTTIENGEWYAEYLHATNEAINTLNITVNGSALDVNVIGAGIAHNDVAYMDAMFAKLDALGADIDGFSIHPYTTYAEDYSAPDSGRPTDWVGSPTNNSESWDYYYSFQGALYSTQNLMNTYGFGDSELWLTEFGVPSYLGYRNAGEDGIIDQARWFAEAFGVFDSWDNSNLKGIMAHHVLDNDSLETNQQYNAYDGNENNDGTGAIAEASFGLFHEVNGTIVSKPAAWLMASITSGEDFQFENIESTYTQSVLNYSSWGASSGLVSGVIALSHDGDDTITGSAFDDSLFAGNGNDTVYGGAGNDRIYGGQGNDALFGGAGSDDLYGNTGDDTIYADEGDRVDGGTGWDRLVLGDSNATYSGDGESLTIFTNGQEITAINMEQLELSDGSVIDLDNADINRGNGGGTGGSSGGNTAPDAVNDTNNDVDAGASITINVLDNDSDADGDALTITQINGIDMQATWDTWIDGVGVVILNADNTITIAPEANMSGSYSFNYTVSDGETTDTATVSGVVQVPNVNSAPSVVDDDNINIIAGTQTTIDVLANDSDADGDALTVTKINGEAIEAGWTTYVDGAGVVTLNADNTLSFGDNEAVAGLFDFTYTVSDGEHSSTASVSGTISEVSIIEGTSGNDVPLQGTPFDDIIAGLEGNDEIFGGAGNDEIYAGAGDDYLVGGAGSDVFAFAGTNLGENGIDDFEVGSDQIRFDAGTGIDNYSDVQNVMYQDSGSTIIDLGNNSVVVLYDFDMNTLSESDFIFA